MARTPCSLTLVHLEILLPNPKMMGDQRRMLSWPVLALVKLDVVSGLSGRGGVFPHHIIVNKSWSSEQGEAARGAEDAPEDVLRGLLQPVAHRVLELLIPGDVARASRMNPPASSTHPLNKTSYFRLRYNKVWSEKPLCFFVCFKKILSQKVLEYSQRILRQKSQVN